MKTYTEMMEEFGDDDLDEAAGKEIFSFDIPDPKSRIGDAEVAVTDKGKIQITFADGKAKNLDLKKFMSQPSVVKMLGKR